MIGLIALGACGPLRGETRWQYSTPTRGSLWIDTDRGQPWFDASHQRASDEIAAHCNGQATIVWEGVVASSDAIAWQHVTKDDGDVRVETANVQPIEHQVWEMRFECTAPNSLAVNAPPAPTTATPIDMPPAPKAQPRTSSAPPCCKR